MPTGYTAELVERGQTFEQFAMTCARAFGALIDMRDAPADAEIPEEFTPSDYYEGSVRESEAELARLRAMNDAERAAFAESRREEAIASAERYLQKEKAQNGRIDSMIAAVNAWKPPTADHAGLKDFMLEQLSISRSDMSYAEKNLQETTEKSVEDFYAEAVQHAEWVLEHRRESFDKEKSRASTNSAWVKALRESVQGK